MSAAAVIDNERPDLGGNLRHGDDRSHVPELWHYLVRRFAVRSVLDVGCGEGHAVSYFRYLGVDAFGIDGLRANVDRAVTPIALVDLTLAPFYMPVDLVWSCEVAEHIEPRFADNYCDTLANGQVVAMTHAEPGQPGYHHVNLQPDHYWVAQMNNRGYDLAVSNEAYRKVPFGESYFAHTGLVFLRR